MKVGWKNALVEKDTPVLPISDWIGDPSAKKSNNMSWWRGMDILVGNNPMHDETIFRGAR